MQRRSSSRARQLSAARPTSPSHRCSLASCISRMRLGCSMRATFRESRVRCRCSTGDMQRLTLDTNLLQEYWRDQAKRDVVQTLLDLAATDAVEIVVTARIGDDIPGGPLAERLLELPEMGVGEI